MKLKLFIGAVLVYSYLLAGTIPKEAGPFRVEVGPPGNEFYEPPAHERGEIKPPSKEMIDAVLAVAPQGAEIDRWSQRNAKTYAIRAELGDEQFDFEITTGNEIIELEYEDEANKTEEVPDELILKGTKEEIEKTAFPQKALSTIAKINQQPVSGTWTCETPVGKRFIAQAGNTVYYSTPEGQIRAIGLVSRGAFSELDPEKAAEKTNEQILADAQKRLLPYQDKFSFAKNIARLGSKPKNPDGSFRFVVMGDSRSQYEMWEAIIQHIDRLDPKPAFVINSGDIVRHGYVDEYLDYYIPPLLKTDIPYFVALGNHDDGDSGLAIEYQVLFGDNSLNYFFDYGAFRFIIMDNSTAVLTPEQTLSWLEKTLESTPKNKKIIVAFHQPPHDIKKWAYHAWDEKASSRLTDILAEAKVEHVFLGHIHAYSTATHKGVDYTISGGGGAGLHDRFGPMGNVHHYVICDVLPDGILKQQVVRFYKE